MMKVRTVVTEKIFCIMLIFVVFILPPITFAEAVTDAPTDDSVQQPCETKCGCEEMYIYDAVNDRCLINFKKVMKRVIVFYENNNVEIIADDEMAKSIYIEGEKLFKGIMISVILFMACASVCVVSACIYCCRINYTDRTLKKHVKALAKKLKRDYKAAKIAPKRAPVPAVSETCSVVVDPAGVYVSPYITVNKNYLVNMLDGSLMDMVLTTLGVLLTMAMLSCLCCICMKFSDLKLKSYVVEMAKKKGLKVDLDKLEPKYKQCQSPQLNENCTIMIPDVAIVL
ncbi:hypothetical protein PYW07_006514 [Mythimna separata]|uniref:Uncharacterized protein n=1 Tax=Mythimna separata TaxID=271217 RepID=A0AAD7YV00_MYTSE|nr:hypothetical protein PYW07_006514 [Mythimna separata]